MKGLIQWTVAVAADGLLAWLFYLWQWEGVDGAGNVVLFFSWAVSILWILAVANMDKTSDWSARPTLFTPYTVATDLIFIGAFAWIDCFWTASVMVVAFISKEGGRLSACKDKKSS